MSSGERSNKRKSKEVEKKVTSESRESKNEKMERK